jgi:anti-anti-sigma factor
MDATIGSSWRRAWPGDDGGGRAGPAHRLDRTLVGTAGRVVIAGEIDLECAGNIRDALVAALDEQDVCSIVVDLTSLRFMDGTCARVLLSARRLADRRGVAMSVVGATGIPRQVLQILGLYDELRTPRTAGHGAGRPPERPKGW